MLRVDLHLHSAYSHDSRTSLESLIARCRELPLDRIALTDHNTAEGALELKRMAPELAIVGEEIKTTEGEIVALFIEETIRPFQRPEAVMDLVHEQGGLVYLAHPFDRFRASFAPHRVVELADRVDIIEVYNAWARPEDNRAAARMCAELDIVAATGSDAHSADELGRSWMEIEPYEGVEDFLEKLRTAHHVVTSLSGTGRRA